MRPLALTTLVTSLTLTALVACSGTEHDTANPDSAHAGDHDGASHGAEHGTSDHDGDHDGMAHGGGDDHDGMAAGHGDHGTGAHDGAAAGNDAHDATAAAGGSSPANLYALDLQTLAGEPAEMSRFEGQVALVVNVASECGYTPQYTGLQELHEQYAEQGLVVMGFPCNDFGGQEPGSPEQIQTFCTTSFGVDFPMFGKCVTRPGADQSPVYAYLGEATGELPNWNFCKYLVDRSGQAVAFFPSRVAPDDPVLVEAIEAALRG